MYAFIHKIYTAYNMIFDILKTIVWIFGTLWIHLDTYWIQSISLDQSLPFYFLSVFPHGYAIHSDTFYPQL